MEPSGDLTVLPSGADLVIEQNREKYSLQEGASQHGVAGRRKIERGHRIDTSRIYFNAHKRMTPSRGLAMRS